MSNQVLANLIPDDNVADMQFARQVNSGVNVMADVVYAPQSRFIGTFLDDDESPSWARLASRYLDDEFLRDTPGRIKLFGDVIPMLDDDGARRVLVNCRHALELWKEGGEVGPAPYTCQQDYGSCVDASCAEHECTLFGWRVAQGTFNEQWKHSSAWYKYADRGYCSDGWNGSGIATVARRVGAAFRIRYDIAGNSIDFTDDDYNERVVARTWCRSGIPSWLKSYTQEHHAYDDGAITRWQGGVKELRALFAAGGVIHTSGRRTSGGSKPFTIGSVGPHMQSGVGCDDSDAFRRFCREVIGVTPRENDFPVIMNQTWGAGWRGECADKYWPEWWGPKPQGAWVWWASDVLSRLSVDYAWLPWVKGFPSDTPDPIPTPQPNIGGELYAEQIAGGAIVIRGELTLDDYEYIAAPKPQTPGRYVIVPKPIL